MRVSPRRPQPQRVPSCNWPGCRPVCPNESSPSEREWRSPRSPGSRAGSVSRASRYSRRSWPAWGSSFVSGWPRSTTMTGCWQLDMPAGARPRRPSSKNVVAATSPSSPPTLGRSDAAGPLGGDILAILNRHQVDDVVIGAFAAIAQGAPLEATHDVDLTPRRDTEKPSTGSRQR